MSNLDTTLREKFSIWHYNNNYTADSTDIEDWWIGQFHQLLNEKREAIEGKRKKIRKDMPRVTQKYWEIHNDTLDDVLSILKD